MNKNNADNKWTVLELFYRALSRCSTTCLFSLAKRLAYFVTRTTNKVSRQTEQSIQLCFPELNKEAQQQLVAESIQHTSCTFFELAFLWFRPIPQVLGKITTQNIDTGFFECKSGRIIVAPHQGSWEMLNLWLAANSKLYSLYKPARSAAIDQLIFRKRSRNSANLVPANTSGLRTLLKGLNNQSSCMILPDQRPATNTAQANAAFFGYPAATSLLIKKLAEKTDCQIFIAAVSRDLKNADYHLEIKPLIRENILSDNLSSALYLNTSIQHFVSRHIEQYQWSYRRYSRQTYRSLKA